MTLQNVGPIIFPFFHYSTGFAGGTANDFLMDADGEKVAFIFSAPLGIAITSVWFRSGALAVSDTIKASLQAIDLTTGDPDGTVLGGGSPASGTVLVDTANINYEVTLGNSYTPIKGDRIALVLEFNSFVAGDLNIQAVVGTAGWSLTDTYVDLNIAASWTRQNNRVPMLSIEHTGGVFAYIPGAFPVGTMVFTTFDSADSPDEIGNKFRLPIPATVAGFAIHKRAVGGAGADYDAVLYDSDGSSVLQTKSMDFDLDPSTGNGYNMQLYSGVSNLTKDTDYRIVCKPASATATIRIYSIESVPSAAHLDQLPGGQNVHKTSRTDAGGWTDDTTSRVFMAVLLSAFDDGVGGVADGVSYIIGG